MIFKNDGPHSLEITRVKIGETEIPLPGNIIVEAGQQIDFDLFLGHTVENIQIFWIEPALTLFHTPTQTERLFHCCDKSTLAGFR